MNLATLSSILFVGSCLAVVGVVAAGILSALRRWEQARRVSGASLILALLVVLPSLVTLLLLALAPELVAHQIAGMLPADDPGTKARALGEFIATVMNCGALALLSLPLSGVLWWLSARRHRGESPTPR